MRLGDGCVVDYLGRRPGRAGRAFSQRRDEGQLPAPRPRREHLDLYCHRGLWRLAGRLRRSRRSGRRRPACRPRFLHLSALAEHRTRGGGLLKHSAASSTRTRVALALVAVIGLASIGLAIGNAPVAQVEGSTVPDAALSTPVLSARRVPSLVAREVADRILRSRLGRALADPAYGAAAQQSCLVVDQGQRRIHEIRPDLALIPASNLKLLTASAALEHFGADYRFVTEFRASSPPSDGVISGDLWIVGGGDPVIMTDEYAASFPNQPQLHTKVSSLADALVSAGVREVRGDLVGDDSRYDDVRFIPTWKPGYVTQGAVGPLGALLVNDGFTAFGSSRAVASAPPAHAAGLIASAAERAGVVLGAVTSGEAPEEAVAIATVESPPLSEILEALLRESDNTTAELLIKELGLSLRGEGSTAAGLDAMDEVLVGAGVDPDLYEPTDGSGLDRGNRASCRALDLALTEQNRENVIGRGLAVAAKTGTLARRFHDTPAAGQLRAKTGALDGVVSLSGWAPTGTGSPIDFAFIANGVPSESRGRQLQELIGVAVALYPEAPPESELSPRPVISRLAAREG
ncbi:MAG: D-alanyl-D-alanine carboxypeptidase/D-alanyl-D-alanine-endopeptidase [Actinobacteria bacterium]|nr:D-alanyl-D-alanine carboxypeptidase/D-alanyl-D-alanine-endopeptidase [Actinomycetota bacterium]